MIERWIENPYWQYFYGFDYMQHECPIHPTSMVKWRQMVGAEKLESLLAETIRIALKDKQVTSQQLHKVTVDTTVQEKAIVFPTDARPYIKMLLRLVNLSKKCGIQLRQTLYSQSSTIIETARPIRQCGKKINCLFSTSCRANGIFEITG